MDAGLDQHITTELVANRPTAHRAAWHGNSSDEELGKVEDGAEGFSRGTDAPWHFRGHR
jgi:hypothetical protein